MHQLMPLIADGFFDFVAQKNDEIGGYKYEAKISVVELFNEVMTDLLRPTNHDLSVQEHYLDGVSPKGVLEKTVRTADEMIVAFEEAGGAQNTSKTDFGPASNYTAMIFTITLVQHIGADRVVSKFQFVEVPCTDKLLIEPGELRTLEGSTLNKSLLAFQSVCKGLAGQQGKEFISHRNALFTHLLVEALGGNCVTLCIALLNPNHFDGNRATLGLVEMLQRVSNYPVMNDGHLQGLLCRYRLSMENIQDKIESIKSEKKGGEDADSSDDVMLRLTELEGRLIKDNLEKIQLKDDKHQVYSKLMEFRTKYNELVEGKSDVQKSLLDAEEEKLKLSKALLDLKIEQSQQAEKTEQEKYDLVTKLLNAENDILELEMREQNREKVDETLKESLTQMTSEKKQLAVEFVTLKSNYVDRNKECQHAQTKVKQLGVELLSLVNQKNVLTQSRDQLERAKKQMLEQQRTSQEQLHTLKGDLDQLKSRVTDQEQRYDQLRNEKARLELDLQHSTIAFESRKLETDKNSEEFARERDAEVYDMKKRHEGEVHRSVAEKSTLQEQNSTLMSQLRQQQRKTTELHTALERKTQEELRVAAENGELVQSNSALAENYRAKLLQYIQENASEVQVHQVALEGENMHSNSSSSNTNMLDELLATYQSKEAEMATQVDDLRQRNHEVVRKNRLLYEKFKAVRYQLEDLNPGTVLPDLPEERDIRSGDPTELEAEMERETKLMVDRVRSSQSELTKQQERALQMAETFKATIAGLERKCQDLGAIKALLGQEKVDLQQRLVAAESGGGGGSSAGNEAALSQMKELQDKLMDQMTDIKKAQEEAVQKAAMAAMQAAQQQQQQQQQPPQNPYNQQQNSGGGGESSDRDRALISDLKRENSDVRDKLRSADDKLRDVEKQLERAEKQLVKAEAEVDDLKNRASTAPAPAPAPAPAADFEEPKAFTFPTSDADLVKMKTQEEAIEKLNQDLLAARGGTDVAKELGEVERRCVGLVSRNAVLEEELKSFKSYMTNVTAKYKKQISKLKKKK